ncbi:MAG: hypothetical protein AAGA56_21915 [Myxococcota bacterium]
MLGAEGVYYCSENAVAVGLAPHREELLREYSPDEIGAPPAFTDGGGFYDGL